MTRYPKSGKGSQWTNRELEAIPTDWQGDTLADGGGLSGEVRLDKAGTIRVYFRYGFRWEGAKRWYQCGAWPAVPLARIRKERDRARQQVSDGVNPTLAKKAARIESKATMEATLAKAKRDKTQSLTVANLYSEWIRDGVARADGNAVLRSAFEMDVLPAIGTKPLRNVTDKDLLELLRKSKERASELKQSKGGNSALGHLAGGLKQMLRWAEKRQPWRALLIEGNPSDLIDAEKLLDLGYQAHRDRVLSADEIKALHRGLLPLAAQHLPTRGAIIRRMRFCVWICLSTLCRIGELVAAKWEHVDWEQGTWLIPAANTKGKRGKRQAQLVTLSVFALEQFRQLHTETGDSVYCFPTARNKGEYIIQTDASGLINTHQKEGGHYPVLSGGHWTLHDMRRTGATLMQQLGVPLEVIDRCQNHVLAGSRVRRHYMHHAYTEEKGEAWRKLGEYLQGLLRG